MITEAPGKDTSVLMYGSIYLAYLLTPSIVTVQRLISFRSSRSPMQSGSTSSPILCRPLKPRAKIVLKSKSSKDLEKKMPLA